MKWIELRIGGEVNGDCGQIGVAAGEEQNNGNGAQWTRRASRAADVRSPFAQLMDD